MIDRISAEIGDEIWGHLEFCLLIRQLSKTIVVSRSTLRSRTLLYKSASVKVI